MIINKQTGMKHCSACKLELFPKSFSKNRRQPDGLNNQCKACVREKNEETKTERAAKYRKNYDKGKIAERNHKTYAKYAESYRKKARESARQIKLEVMLHYGPGCAECGESDPDMLNLDHVNNDGKTHRVTRHNGQGSSTNLYRKVRMAGFPNPYKGCYLQVLCANHNLKKQIRYLRAKTGEERS